MALLFRRMSMLSNIILIYIFLCTIFVHGYKKQEWAEIGRNFSLECTTEDEKATWMFGNKTIDEKNTRLKVQTMPNVNVGETNRTHAFVSKLFLADVNISDAGNYTCKHAATNESTEFNVQTYLPSKIVESTADKIRRKIGQDVVLFCLVEVYPQNATIHKNLKWLKDGSAFPFMDTFSSTAKLNETHLNFTLEFTEVYKKENGTYKCVVYDSAGTEGTSKEINLFVMEVPQVSIEFAKAVGASKIFLNWTVNDGNDPVQKYFISFSQQGTPTYTYYKDIINGNNTSYILESFLPNTTYSLRILGKNSIGDGAPNQYPVGITTLSFDPIFIHQGGNDWEHSVDDNKQYIFLYRALLDTGTFGNTDLCINSMASAIESLKRKPNEGKCKLEMEFEVSDKKFQLTSAVGRPFVLTVLGHSLLKHSLVRLESSISMQRCQHDM
ncbi:GL25206 [Drosophila persimilis]|uniref:GL25206 n=1 Tax=Drosophila persimilis TaxID=7234 RepID=B4GRH8_DROPE|nr:GL25206 [Drosophila persimilis]